MDHSIHTHQGILCEDSTIRCNVHRPQILGYDLICGLIVFVMTAEERQEVITAIARKLLRGVITWEEALTQGRDNNITEAELEDAIDKIVRG